MVPVGKRYGTESGGWFQISRRTPEQLVFERLVKPGKGKADPHVHLDFVQTWECVTGSGAIEVEGERRELKAGDRVVLHLNTAHRDPFTGEDRRAATDSDGSPGRVTSDGAVTHDTNDTLATREPALESRRG